MTEATASPHVQDPQPTDLSTGEAPPAEYELRPETWTH